MDSHIDAITASGNATLYLVAFLATDNSTPKYVRYQASVKNDLDTHRATADHLLLYQYWVELVRGRGLTRLGAA